MHNIACMLVTTTEPDRFRSWRISPTMPPTLLPRS